MNKKEMKDKLTKLIDLKGNYNAYSIDSKQRLNAVGNFEGISAALKLIDRLDEPELPVIPQFVADWYEQNKNSLDLNIFSLIVDTYESDNLNRTNIQTWANWEHNKPIETLVRMKDGYTVEKESKQYVVKIGKGYFCGYDELKAVFVLDDQPSSMDNVVKYSDKEEAESAANNIGGTVEPKSEEEKTRQVLVKFFDSQEYRTELTEEAARELIEFLEANKK